MKYAKYRYIFYSILLCCILLHIPGCVKKDKHSYGVFLGIGSENISRLYSYTTVVIEPAEFNKEDIADLHRKGKIVYGYLNIGALEEYRPYFHRFENIVLGIYEDWPDECWIDVSSKDWQAFIIDELGKQYADMGFDGFFLDNTDIYYHYPKKEIYQGLVDILTGLGKYHVELIVNGGDTFVSKCMEQGVVTELFDGINQESVFTNTEQSGESLEYYQNYLSKIKESGLQVYLLEYQADAMLKKDIENYCRENDFIWYHADSKDLR